VAGTILLPWILLLPLAGALVNGLLGPRLNRRTVALIGNLTVFTSFLLAIFAFFIVRALPVSEGETPRLVFSFGPWLASTWLHLDLALLFDPLSAVMTLVVTGVGAFIHLYSAGYMAHDRSPARYFAYLNLFLFSMLLLVLGENLVMLFAGWEGVGLCSYLLIGFWFEDMDKAIAGKKAFLVNRVGDFGFALAIFLLLYFTNGHVGFPFLERWASTGGLDPLHGFWITVITLMLFVGATGKSAQIPLYVWLPDAMAGPTPVSALIHAATMVTAGVYMVARLNFLFLDAPLTMAVVAGVGAFTALYAASIGLVQNDIKKVLAYSTISQLGYMFLGVGVGAFTAGIFHLVTHAFFKACLFLGAGSVIHALAGEQDIRKMGGLGRLLPITRWTFLISCLAIAGVPLFSGFFSKDEILWRAFSNRGLMPGGLSVLYWAVAAAGALMTAFYMFRLYFLTFAGESRVAPGVHPHESPRSMTIPLMVLAFAATLGGFISLPIAHGNLLEEWLAPVFLRAEHVVTPSHDHSLEYTLMAVSVVIALAGIFLARAFYLGGWKAMPGRLATSAGGLYRLVLDKYRVDELYAFLFVRPFAAASRFGHRVVDVVLIDLLGVNGTGWAVQVVARALRYLQTGQVQQYLAGMLVAAAVLGYLVLGA
jgi:NADH-quinone oxidoreductase subunit L